MKKNKRKLTPKLRFPEFRDGPYHKVRLGDVAEDATERNRKTLDADVVMGVFKGEGMRPMERRLVANNISRYKVVEKDWFAYNPMRLNIGSIARWSGDEPVLVSPDYIVFRCSNDSDQKIDPNYLDHFRYSDQWDRFVTLSGDGSVRVRIYFRDIATLRLILPSLSEQQKIAECLSSLDGLIAAEGRKLAALKAHKKGLMQQIFPGTPTSSSAGGESAGGDAGAPSQPRLRFPEFRDKGEWEERQLGDVADVLMCKRIFANETNVTGGVPFYKIGTLGGTPDAYIRKTLFKEYKSKCNFPRKGEILITCSGTIGKCLQYDGGDAYFQDSNIVWIDNPTLVLSNEFLLSILSGVDWSRLNSTTITRIYGPDLRGLLIKFPENKKEQHRIADCLTVLDTRIAAQASKIETLRQHKRGLMQQLFPAPEESEA